MKYKRIANRRKELLNRLEGLSIEETLRETLTLMEMDSIDNFFECESYKTYERIAQFCKMNGFARVYDVGCAFGFQSEVFLNEGVDYRGINEHILPFWNQESFQYQAEHYPFKIESRKEDLAISVLCLTWNVYLYEKEKTLKEQCEALQRDFENCVLYISEDKVDFVKQYFKKSEVLGRNLIYFSN